MSDLDPPIQFEAENYLEEKSISVFDNGGRQTTRRLTKFERAKILGTRADQISKGAPILIDAQGETNCLKIAMMEEAQGKIPMIIRRFFPPGDKYEDWNLEELFVTN